MKKNLSVLIVDDEESDRYILKRKLDATGMHIDIFDADDGQKAIDFLSDYSQKRKEFGDKFPPIIIFLDINMPMLDGFGFLDAFAELRSVHEDYIDCVIMMFSSSESEADREKAFSRGFVKDFILKGEIETDDLKQKVQTVLHGS